MLKMDIYRTGLRNYLLNLHLDDAVIDDLMVCFHIRQYRKNEYFAFAGERADKLGFLVSGLFFMHTLRENGTVFVKDFMVHDQFILASFDPKQEAGVCIQALKDSILLESKYSDVQSVFKRYPDLGMLALRGMEKRFESLCGRLESFAGMQAKERYDIFKQTYGMIEEEIPQHLIASYIGITPTQLSRIRKHKIF
jgi:CRP-like cAMP-binding protein